MRHDKFAGRAAERLEAVAAAIEDEDRARQRDAGRRVKNMAATLKREETEACVGNHETRSGIDRAKETVELEREPALF